MLEIQDYYELLALNRALMEVRYLAKDVDDATRGSPLLTSLHVSTIEEIKAYLKDTKGESEAAAWDDWRRLENRKMELPRILEYLAPLWPRLSSVEQKREAIANQLRPFSFRSDDVERMMSELDQRAARWVDVINDAQAERLAAQDKLDSVLNRSR